MGEILALTLLFAVMLWYIATLELALKRARKRADEAESIAVAFALIGNAGGAVRLQRALAQTGVRFAGAAKSLEAFAASLSEDEEASDDEQSA